MNQGEDREKLLFDSLGVTSANVEDVERKILSQVKPLFLMRCRIMHMYYLLFAHEF